LAITNFVPHIRLALKIKWGHKTRVIVNNPIITLLLFIGLVFWRCATVYQPIGMDLSRGNKFSIGKLYKSTGRNVIIFLDNLLKYEKSK
jgi:hypothetical protein